MIQNKSQHLFSYRFVAFLCIHLHFRTSHIGMSCEKTTRRNEKCAFLIFRQQFGHFELPLMPLLPFGHQIRHSCGHFELIVLWHLCAVLRHEVFFRNARAVHWNFVQMPKLILIHFKGFPLEPMYLLVA